MEVELHNGGVRMAPAYGGRPSEMVTVQCVHRRNGIMEVEVRPPRPSMFARVASI